MLYADFKTIKQNTIIKGVLYYGIIYYRLLKFKSNDFSPLPEGEYEVVIKSATERATKMEKKETQLQLVIRNDLKKHQNYKLNMQIE